MTPCNPSLKWRVSLARQCSGIFHAMSVSAPVKTGKLRSLLLPSEPSISVNLKEFKSIGQRRL
jgi:hypothetical protein